MSHKLGLSLAAVLATAAAACTGAGAQTSPTSARTEPVPVKIAFFEDSSIDGASQLVTPAYLGVQLALTEGQAAGDLPVVPILVGEDTKGDPARAAELAAEVAADPSFVGAVIGPFWSETVDVAQALSDSGVPTLSISSLGPGLASGGLFAWRRVVVSQPQQAAAFASAVRATPAYREGVCLGGDGTAYAKALSGLVLGDLGSHHVRESIRFSADTDAAAGLSKLKAARCGVLAWTGMGTAGALLRSSITQAGLDRVSFVGSDATKLETYLTVTDGAGDGTVVTCPCVDLTTSTRVDAQRFIHDFQAEYGSPPGAYAAEGWDVGGMFLAGFRAGAATRAAVAEAVASTSSYEGLANDYRFTSSGELEGSSARVHTYRAEGLRWLPIAQGRAVDLPVGTEGFLSVAACRSGAPYAYLDQGRLAGFDVELARAIASRLGLELSWEDLSCRSAARALRTGNVDAVLAPAVGVSPGTPTSRVVLSVHVALVADRRLAKSGHVLGKLGPGDVVGVVAGPETAAYANATIPGTGATIQVLGDRRIAYSRLSSGGLTAVADLEPDAWAAIERRPSLRVGQSFDAGAHDVVITSGTATELIAAIDQAFGRLMSRGRYALLFAKYFPGTPIPNEVGQPAR